METLKTTLTLIKQDANTKKIVSVESISSKLIKSMISKDEMLLVDCDLDAVLHVGNFTLAEQNIITPENKFSFSELLPVVAVDLEGKVLMQAFLNSMALAETFKTGYATYFSRSRNKIWLKGESSDNKQELVEAYYTEKNSFFVYVVKQKTAACHEGFYSCFFRKINPDGHFTQIDFDRKFKPEKVYG